MSCLDLNNPIANLTRFESDGFSCRQANSCFFNSYSLPIDNNYQSKYNQVNLSIEHLDKELRAPIVSLDLEEWFDSIIGDCEANIKENQKENLKLQSDKDNCLKSKLNTNLIDSIDLCSSLEDLVKTFDKNVKECLSNYKDIDIGQLAPVQVRSQEDIINDSQIWYTLTGNFGNLLPINYWSNSLVKKYHDNSLNVNNKKNLKSKSKIRSKQKQDEYFDEELETQSDFDEQENLFDDIEYSFKMNSENRSEFEEYSHLYDAKCRDYFDFYDEDNEEDDDEDENNYDDDEDENNYEDDELRDQLDMHSMILSKSVFNGEPNEEPIITAEQVLNEIDSMITMQDEFYDEMTPDSGCFSVNEFNNLINSADSNQDPDLSIDLSGPYLKYINTFALHANKNSSNNNENNINFNQTKNENNEEPGLSKLNLKAVLLPFNRDLKTLNNYELNDLIEQIEASTKELSDTLVHELALRDELEFEKETKNTFITLLMSLEEKRRQLSNSNINNYQLNNRNTISKSSNISNSLVNSNCKNNKKMKRRSLVNFNPEKIYSSYLTTVIPFNVNSEFTVQHLQILNKLLKAINEDSYQVPELLTNYILKFVCPT